MQAEPRAAQHSLPSAAWGSLICFYDEAGLHAGLPLNAAANARQLAACPQSVTHTGLPHSRGLSVGVYGSSLGREGQPRALSCGSS